MKQAFTLVKLLVVIAIIVVLLALLVPALDRAMEMTLRAVCASHLDAIHTGVASYALSNRQVLIICRGRRVQIAFNPLGVKVQYNSDADAAVDWPAALASVGLADSVKSRQPRGAVENSPSKVWNCPSRKFDSFWDGRAQLAVGYQYLAGMPTWTNAYGTIAKAPSPKKLSSPGGWALAADVTVRNDGVWGTTRPAWALYYPDIPPHKRSENAAPAGHNQVFMDGSASWIDANKLVSISDWFATVDHQAFWYQQDLGGWTPPAGAYATPSPN